MTDSLTLSFERTVPCALAHRRAIGEVFVADTAQAGPDEFLAAIQIPRAHSLWFDRCEDFHDPLSTVEAVRQAMIVLGHRYLGVTAGTPASLQRIDFTVEDLSAYRDGANAPLEGVVRVRLTPEANGYASVAESSFKGALTIGGALAMTLRGSAIQFPAEDYRQLRAHHQKVRPPADGDQRVERARPTLVGRRDPRNVVVGAGRVDFGPAIGPVIPLVVDQRHPSFFDHPYDHVPGPLLLEGCRQAAVVAAVDAGVLDSPVVALTACTMAFEGFAELGPVIGCAAAVFEDPDSCGARVEVTVYQFGCRIGQCSLELSPYPGAPETH